VSRLLNDLHPTFRPAAFELLARFTEAGICTLIVDTLRTQAEHEKNLAAGRSWTKRSKHLAGLAIDVCPYEVWQLDGPDKLRWSYGPVWQQMGNIASRTLPMLIWGGTWPQRDLGHFEWPTWEGTQ